MCQDCQGQVQGVPRFLYAINEHGNNAIHQNQNEMSNK